MSSAHHGIDNCTIVPSSSATKTQDSFQKINVNQSSYLEPQQQEKMKQNLLKRHHFKQGGLKSMFS